MVLPAALDHLHRLHAFGRGSISDDCHHGCWRQCRETAWTICFTAAVGWAARRFTTPASLRWPPFFTDDRVMALVDTPCVPPNTSAHPFVTGNSYTAVRDLRRTRGTFATKGRDSLQKNSRRWTVPPPSRGVVDGFTDRTGTRFHSSRQTALKLLSIQSFRTTRARQPRSSLKMMDVPGVSPRIPLLHVLVRTCGFLLLIRPVSLAWFPH